MKKKLTIAELLALKGQRQFTQVFVSTPEEAAACEEAGIDVLVARVTRAREIRAAAPATFLTIPIPMNTAFSETEAIRLGFENMSMGADAVYTGVSTAWVKAMAREHIPVIGHVGLVPYRSSWYGGFRAVGKTADEALWVYQETCAYRDAGAIGVEMELVPTRIAEEISRRVDIMIISMGSGNYGSAQYLFACDILGTGNGAIPRHAKKYLDLKSEYERIQQMMIDAFREFKTEVDAGIFPGKGHTVDINDAEHLRFLKLIDQSTNHET